MQEYLSCQKTYVTERRFSFTFPVRGGTFPSCTRLQDAAWESHAAPRQLTPVALLSFCCRQTETEDEKRRFEEGKGRYLQTKAKRQAQMQQAAQQ